MHGVLSSIHLLTEKIVSRKSSRQNFYLHSFLDRTNSLVLRVIFPPEGREEARWRPVVEIS
jgi:hypothetical protein